jgi:hypothetical protein
MCHYVWLAEDNIYIVICHQEQRGDYNCLLMRWHDRVVRMSSCVMPYVVCNYQCVYMSVQLALAQIIKIHTLNR